MWFNPSNILSYDCLWNFVIGNRGGGKSFNTLDFYINRFRKCGEQFAYIRRTEAELEKVKDKLFTALQAEGKHAECEFKIVKDDLYCDGKLMGFCMPLSQAHHFKSSGFPNVTWILFDEFIPETGSYALRDEVGRFISLFESIARLRRVRVMFLANALSLNNVYFEYLKIKPNRGSKFTRIKNKSIVIEIYADQEYINIKKATEFGQIISGTKYSDYIIDNEFLLDNYGFIEPLGGASIYKCTIAYQGKLYGVHYVNDLGLYHISEKPMRSHPLKFSFTTDDHKPNYILFKTANQNPVIKMLKYAFDMGCMRFTTLSAKQAIYELFKYI